MNRRIVAAVSTSAALVAGLSLLTANLLLAKHPSNDSPPDVPIVPLPRPVPLLSPEDEAKTFNLPEGFRAEVVAAEPMIQHPVQVQFDADGRLWVVEMRGYMPDVDGNGEDQPVGQISILEDTDNDGRMDKSTVFMDKLVLPRALGLVRDGALVAVPPKLMFCRDTDGDGRADQFTDVATDYGIGGNPEHQPNGLLVGLDNWVWNADYDKRFRYNPATSAFAPDVIPDMGQWGISQDDWGRLYHNGNSDYLRAALIPPSYGTRNPYYRSIGGNVQIAKDQTVWPAHAAAVNRGYTKGFLRDDGTLKNFTAACAPVVYRGDLLPKDFVGDVFVCESSANVVRRATLNEGNGTVTAKNAYPDGKEFIASTYERFRPVNLANGPDGALYVVDMHHGIIQHTAFVTSYGIAQYHGRELHKHLGTGRIFRIVPDNGAKRPAPPKLSKATTTELIEHLSHANGWYRDTAQRLIVDRNERAAVMPLRKVATTSENPLARLHALWALEGITGLNSPTLNAALKDAHPKVRAAAIRLCEPTLGSQRRENVLPGVLSLAADKEFDVRLQFVLTVSEIGSPESDEILADVLASSADNALIRDAAVTGLHGRELEFLRLLAKRSNWSSSTAGRPELVSNLSQCVVAQANPARVGELLELATAGGWKGGAILNGFPAGDTRKGSAPLRPILLPTEPAALAALQKSADPKVKAGVERVTAAVVWPGKPGYVAPPPVKPLTSEEQMRFESGRAVYDMLCGQCHRPDGQGKDGLAPPLVNSEWVTGSEQRLIRIAIGGLQGPITVNGKVYNLDMPAWKMLDDEKLAAALTYVRRAWGHTASPIQPATVKQVREETAGRTQPWTERELLLIK